MADRGFSSTIDAALSSHEVTAALAVYLNWVGGPVRLWSGNGIVSWNSQSWTGAGKLGGIDKITDSVDRADIGIQLTLNYLDDALRNEVITNNSVGRSASVYFWLMNPTTVQVIDGYEMFTGFIDRCEIEDAGSSGSLMIRLASELAKLRRARFFTLADGHQQYLFPDDKGCEFATKMDEAIMWGRKPVGVATGVATGRPRSQPATPSEPPTTHHPRNQPTTHDSAPPTSHHLMG